jgi:chromosome segregation ATPase
MIISHLTSKGTLERSEGKTLTLTQENKTLRLRAAELEELIKKPKHELAKINDAQKKQIALLEADLKARDKEIAKLKNDLAIANKEIARNSAAIDLLMKDYNARKRKEPLSDNNASSDDEAEEAFHASKKPKKPPVRRLIHNSSSTKHKTLDDDSYKHKPLFSKPKGRKVPGPIYKTVKPRHKH